MAFAEDEMRMPCVWLRLVTLWESAVSEKVRQPMHYDCACACYVQGLCWLL